MPDPEPEPLRLRDDLVLLAAAAILEASAQFSTVEVVTGPDDVQFDAEDGSTAVLWPESWAEQTDATGEYGIESVHTGRFILAICTRVDDPRVRLQRQFRLQSVAMNLLNGQSLAGFTFPALTRLGAAQRDGTITGPSSCWLLAGEWQAVVEADDRHDVIDDE